jgi:hypothetical protein
MTGIKSEDRLPLIAASLVLVVGNVVVYLSGSLVYLGILATPLALAAFGVVRYLLHGSPLPEPIQN